MTDKTSYLKFKNEIMLNYVDRPDKWNANKNERPKRRHN